MSFKMIFASAAAVAMAAGTPAFAAKSQNQNQNRQVAASDAAGGSGGVKAKKICRTYANTASRLKREKLCLTREGWREFERSDH